MTKPAHQKAPRDAEPTATQPHTESRQRRSAASATRQPAPAMARGCRTVPGRGVERVHVPFRPTSLRREHEPAVWQRPVACTLQNIALEDRRHGISCLQSVAGRLPFQPAVRAQQMVCVSTRHVTALGKQHANREPNLPGPSECSRDSDTDSSPCGANVPSLFGRSSIRAPVGQRHQPRHRATLR